MTAVIHGARKEEPSADVQQAAINALFNSLEFIRENFEREVWHVFLAFIVGTDADVLKGRAKLHHASRV